jgi:hypothetical protein
MCHVIHLARTQANLVLLAVRSSCGSNQDRVRIQMICGPSAPKKIRMLHARRVKKALIAGMDEAGLRAWGLQLTREREWQPREVCGDRHKANVFLEGR